MEEIWDEHRWEDFLREADRRTDLYLRMREAYVRQHPPPPEGAPEAEREAWRQALDAHLAARMGWSLGTGGGAVEEFDPEDLGLPEDPPEEGEDWKSGLAELYPETQDVTELPLWQAADAFGQAVLEWSDTVPERYKDDALVEVCANALQVAAKLAAAHGMGYETEVLGGNIAQTKRALAAANRALVALQSLRDAPFLAPRDYRRLYEQGFEVRNAVGLHVQALRERFEREARL